MRCRRERRGPVYCGALSGSRSGASGSGAVSFPQTESMLWILAAAALIRVRHFWTSLRSSLCLAAVSAALSMLRASFRMSRETL